MLYVIAFFVPPAALLLAHKSVQAVVAFVFYVFMWIGIIFSLFAGLFVYAFPIVILWLGIFWFAPATYTVAVIKAREEGREAPDRGVAYWIGALTLSLVIFVVGLLCAVSLPEIAENEFTSLRDLWRQIDVTESRSIDGMTFPAGSKVVPDGNGHVSSGELPGPTIIFALPLIGEFKLVHDDAPDNRRQYDIERATLAQAAEVDGIPCAAGYFAAMKDRSITAAPGPKDEIVECRLAREFDVLGYALASGGHVRITLSPSGEPRSIGYGVLAKPLTLLHVDWPAGTIVEHALGSAASLNDESPSGNIVIGFCVPAGETVMVKNIEVHGAIYVSGVPPWTIYPKSGCLEQAGAPGYAILDHRRYRSVTFDDDGTVNEDTRYTQPE